MSSRHEQQKCWMQGQTIVAGESIQAGQRRFWRSCKLVESLYIGSAKTHPLPPSPGYPHFIALPSSCPTKSCVPMRGSAIMYKRLGDSTYENHAAHHVHAGAEAGEEDDLVSGNHPLAAGLNSEDESATRSTIWQVPILSLVMPFPSDYANVPRLCR